MSSIKQSMHELGWKENFLSGLHFILYILKIRIVFRVRSVESFPWMNDMTFLRIIQIIILIYITVPATLIAIVPNNNTWMINIPDDQFFYQPFCCDGIVCFLPTGQFIQHK